MNSEKKLTREININNDGIFKTKIGTLNRLTPNVLYIHSKAKAKPLIPDGKYTDKVNVIRDKLTKYVDEQLKCNPLFENKNIFSFEVSDKGLSVGRGSHVKYELYVKPFEVKDIHSYKDEMEKLSVAVCGKIIELFDNNDIECY